VSPALVRLVLPLVVAISTLSVRLGSTQRPTSWRTRGRRAGTDRRRRGRRARVDGHAPGTAFRHRREMNSARSLQRLARPAEVRRDRWVLAEPAAGREEPPVAPSQLGREQHPGLRRPQRQGTEWLIGPGDTDGDRENETDQRAEGNAGREEYDI